MAGMKRCIAAGLLLMIAVGCAPTKSFDVTVRNQSDVPVMLWLTKDGPPAEKGWWTPEQFLEAPAEEPSPGVRLEPQKTADTGKVKGTFPDGTNAVLLIFRTSDAPRVEGSGPIALRLRPGRNELVMAKNEQGRLYVYDPVISVPTPLATEP
jgi:hypothetical protein